MQQLHVQQLTGKIINGEIVGIYELSSSTLLSNINESDFIFPVLWIHHRHFGGGCGGPGLVRKAL